MQIDVYPVSDPAYHFDADPNFCLMRIRILFDADPDFYLMRIQVTKIMRIHANPDPQHWYHHYNRSYHTVRGVWQGVGGVSLYVRYLIFCILSMVDGLPAASTIKLQTVPCNINDCNLNFINSSYFKYGLDQGNWYTDVIAQNISNLLTHGFNAVTCT